VRCHASYFHARTRRLHLLKVIHYDSKIISFDSSRQRRGRHPIKSYVAAPETTIRIRRASLYISFVFFSCAPVVHRYTCYFFFPSLLSHFVATFPEAVQSEELYLAEQPRLRGNRQREEKLFLFPFSSR